MEGDAMKREQEKKYLQKYKIQQLDQRIKLRKVSQKVEQRRERLVMRWKTSLGDFMGISEQESSLEEIVKIKEEDFCELKNGMEKKKGQHFDKSL